MAKNLKHRGGANNNVVLPLTATGKKAGDIIKIGTDLTGYCLTDAATSDTISDGTAAPGLTAGQASVELIGVAVVVALTVAVGAAVGAPVYVTSGGTYTGTKSTNSLIGFAVETIGAGAVGKVALVSAPTPA